MSRESVLTDGRQFVSDGFTETLTFFRIQSGVIPDGEIDPVDVEVVIHENIPGLIKFHSNQVSDQEQAGQLLAVQQVTVKVAVGATPNVRPDHFVRVTASTVDASLVGSRRWRVTGMPQSGQVTAHRYSVEEVS